VTSTWTENQNRFATNARKHEKRVPASSFVVALAPSAAPFVFAPPPAAQVHGENDEEKRHDKQNCFHEGEKSLMDIG
jgi:hypothetical protein